MITGVGCGATTEGGGLRRVGWGVARPVGVAVGVPAAVGVPPLPMIMNGPTYSVPVQVPSGPSVLSEKYHVPGLKLADARSAVPERSRVVSGRASASSLQRTE
jgi:hypothetical protein